MAINANDMQSAENFSRARKRAFFSRMIHILQPGKRDLLSLDDVRKVIQPGNESYRGIKAVPIDLIVGSEGRYRDFTKAFMPKREHLKKRWMNIDKLHTKNINLPPVNLYKIGGVYFVRDGNHRISVCRTQGIEMIDAEIVELDSRIPINADMTTADLRHAVIEFEAAHFEERTGYSKLYPNEPLKFTATGRYAEVYSHIESHKYFINQGYDEEISLEKAIRSWHDNVYLPVVETVKEYGLLSRFPDRSVADLYVWIVKHWHYLKEQFGPDVPIWHAAKDISRSLGMGRRKRLKYFFQKVFHGRHVDD